MNGKARGQKTPMGKSNVNAPQWTSKREQWTVQWGVIILVLIMIIVGALLIYTILDDNTTMFEKVISLANSVLLAILGYLFAYVPTKSSEEAAKKDKDIAEIKNEQLDMAIIKLKKAIRERENEEKDYETLVALLNKMNS